MNNYIHSFILDVITHPYPYFNVALTELFMKLGLGRVFTSLVGRFYYILAGLLTRYVRLRMRMHRERRERFPRNRG